MNFDLPPEELLDLLENRLRNDYGLQVTRQEKKPSSQWHLIVSTGAESIPISIYRTGKVLPQGPQCELRTQIEEFIGALHASQSANIGRSGIQIYKGIESKVCEKIADTLRNGPFDNIEVSPQPNTNFFAKVSRSGAHATITIYESGTIVVQGKTLWLIDRICTMIEKEGDLPMTVVACRLLADVAEADFLRKLVTEEIQLEAEKDCRESLGASYNFLSDYDQKLAISAFVLRLVAIAMPEYSYIVMPMAKAFEGYLHKLLVTLGLAFYSDFNTQGWNFGSVWASGPTKAFVQRHKGHKQHLKYLEGDLPFARHRHQHSDSTGSEQISERDEAIRRIEQIVLAITRSFDHFSTVEKASFQP